MSGFGPIDVSEKKLRSRDVVHRPSSEASRFHMSKAAVDRSVEDFAKMTDLQCVRHFAMIRWGSFTNVTCPHCNSSSEHYWSKGEMRWKCKACGKRFSVTSKTVFANRRMPLQTLLAAIHLWACGAAGQPALELRRMLKFGGYNTAFNLVSKLREGLLRGFNVGLISGVIEIDGAHASGRRASEKRGVPQKYAAVNTGEERPDELLTNIARQKKKRDDRKAAVTSGGNVQPENRQAFPQSRRIVWAIRKRSNEPGRGAVMTRVGVGLAETPEIARALANAYVVIPESILATDSGTAFSQLGKKFQLHLQVNHSETLSGPNGEHNNNAESFTSRQDRAESGVYLNIEPKYLCDYATETAFREDHRRRAPGATSNRALHCALNVGLSDYWRGFTHGHHRDFELLFPANRPHAPSGPAKGKSPISSANGTPPR